MNLLPKELLLIILSLLPIPDKRNLIRCTKQLNKFKDKMEEDKKDFLKMINDTGYIGCAIINIDRLDDSILKYFKKQIMFIILNDLEKYTLEYAYYGYANLIPERYIRNDNKILHRYPLHFNSAKRNFIDLCNILVNISPSKYITSGAASGGNLELLKQLYQKGIKLRKNVCDQSIKNGHFEILKWARENGCEWGSAVCYAAALHGHFEILKWARENGCEWCSAVCYGAARSGHLEILKWARENGCEWCSAVCYGAAYSGYFEILKWAHENGCQWDSKTCSYAAHRGHLEILKWARENGCPWNGNTCSYAASKGHL